MSIKIRMRGYAIFYPAHWITDHKNQESFHSFSTAILQRLKEEDDIVTNIHITSLKLESNEDELEMYDKEVSFTKQIDHQWYGAGNKTKLADLVIGGYPAVKYKTTSVNPAKPRQIFYIIKKDPYLFELSFSVVRDITIDDDILFDQMAQSLMFFPSPNKRHRLTISTKPELTSAAWVFRLFQTQFGDIPFPVARKRVDATGKFCLSLRQGYYMFMPRPSKKAKLIDGYNPMYDDVYLDRDKNNIFVSIVEGI